MAASGELTFRDPPRPHIRHSISFGKWIGNRLHEGEDGHGHTAKFASTDDLIKYWDYRRVRELLKDYPDICAKVDIIRTAYIRVFSILVSTCHLEYLDEFMENGLSDERLPLKERPTQWPESKHLDAVIKDFLSSQWRFCPLQINPRALTGQRLDDRHILPIVSKKILRELHGEAGIIRADFHTSCVEELPTAMILKAYTSLKLYKAEVTAFTKICNSAPNEGGQRPESIIECYGYFVQKDKYYLLLECAERNLESYFKHTKPPESAEDMFQFWKSMFKLVEGLTLIHNLGDLSEGSTSAFRGQVIDSNCTKWKWHADFQIISSHQDIKPGNILVNNKNPTNKYDITLKIADFGMSEFWQVSDENPDALGIDHKGDQWYSPPECAANFDALRRLDNQVGSELDIWSLGCVFSEAAVWAVCGYLGLQTYLEHRQEEAMDSMSRSGFSGCFHNGNGPLNAVTLMHNHILNSRRHWDTITPGVIDLVRGSMLLESMGPRKSARYLLQKSERLIQDAEEKAREEGYIQPTNRALSPLPPPPSANKITVEEVQQYRNDMKKNRPPNEHVATQCNLLKEKIKGRDQIFLVDDSTSMKSQHYNDVMNTFIALSYLAKKIDDNELDLFFTSQPATILSDRRTSKLLTEVQQHYNRRPSLGSSMEYSLSLVINHIIEKLPNPHITFTGIRGLSQWMKPQAKITLFVFTDGRWDSISGVENEITRLINGVKVRNLSRTSVTIQFIRFGDDLDGIGRLKYLDNFGKELGWDIVDTKSHKDHVPDMFIGSIDDTVDDNDDMI